VVDLKEVLARQSVRQFGIRRLGEAGGETDDVVATEEPLEIRLEFTDPEGQRAERSISITMRTPGNDDELAIGFLYTEGIVSRSQDIVLVRPCGPPAENGLINVIRVELADDVKVELDRLERHFYTSSSCGVCGKASLEAVAVQGRFDIRSTELRVPRDVLSRLPDMLLSDQAIFGRTGGLHASGLFSPQGDIEVVREDVGRHNALDKLIGSQLVKNSVPLDGRGIIVSGRASFELMQKAMVAGCPLIVAVGAPSSLAVELALEFGMTLVGFLRRDGMNVYSHPERIS
jgi:FdhD protein